MSDANRIILHHYDASPYAEKIRLALRLKNLAWSSVTIPMIMPKPDLTALTGGYRKTPVMQIGADIYCDTEIILAELERRFSIPSLNLPGHEGLSGMVAAWAASWFQDSVGIVFGLMTDKLPPEFIEDRRAMNKGNLDIEAIKRAVPMLQDKWRANLMLLEKRLNGAQTTGSGDFLIGGKPGLVDVQAYFNIWWMSKSVSDFMSNCFETAPLTQDWFQRLEKMSGQDPEEMTAQTALEIAHAAAPRLKPASTAGELRDLQPGERVAIAPADNGQDWVEGELVVANAERVIISRRDDRAENLHVHFPRAGYLLRAV